MAVARGDFFVSFATLGLIGREIYVKAPPAPDSVVTAAGVPVYSRADIETEREVWQKLGGVELGSVWGHGGYAAPDWGADWHHGEALVLLDIWARKEHDRAFSRM